MLKRNALQFCSAALFLCTVPGCDLPLPEGGGGLPTPDQPGPDETEDHPTPEPDTKDYCKRSVLKLDSLESALPHGQTAAHYLARAAGTKKFVIRKWPQNVDVGSFYPDSVGKVGEMTIEWKEGTARYTESTPIQDEKDNGGRISCFNLIQMDATLRLKSEDGAFAEELDVTIMAEDPDDPDFNDEPGNSFVNHGGSSQARMKQPYDPELFKGSFEVGGLKNPPKSEIKDLSYILSLKFGKTKLDTGHFKTRWTFAPTSSGKQPSPRIMQVYRFEPRG